MQQKIGTLNKALKLVAAKDDKSNIPLKSQIANSNLLPEDSVNLFDLMCGIESKPIDM